MSQFQRGASPGVPASLATERQIRRAVLAAAHRPRIDQDVSGTKCSGSACYATSTLPMELYTLEELSRLVSRTIVRVHAGDLHGSGYG